MQFVGLCRSNRCDPDVDTHRLVIIYLLLLKVTDGSLCTVIWPDLVVFSSLPPPPVVISNCTHTYIHTH